MWSLCAVMKAQATTHAQNVSTRAIRAVVWIYKWIWRTNVMPKFSFESATKLGTCHHDLQVLFTEVIKYWDCTVIEGHRDEVDQELDFANGKTRLHYPHGKHNAVPSMAVDVAPCPVDWHDEKRFYYFAGFVMGVAQWLLESGKISHKVRYGGDWFRSTMVSENKFNDLVHFELEAV
jgi:peptidoglycan L-alanyl-D-glutamate endopeptidase CwlK